MIGDTIIAVLSGVVGGAAWVRLHRHPDLVPRSEFEHVLVELRYIRERLDRLLDER